MVLHRHFFENARFAVVVTMRAAYLYLRGGVAASMPVCKKFFTASRRDGGKHTYSPADDAKIYLMRLVFHGLPVCLAGWQELYRQSTGGNSTTGRPPTILSGILWLRRARE